jgi:hypothetical protein
VKYAWIETYRDQYSVNRLCRMLDVSRSGYQSVAEVANQFDVHPRTMLRLKAAGA